MADKNLGDAAPENGDPYDSSKTEGGAAGDIFTYRKHGMDYFTADGVTLRTGYSIKLYWYLLCIRELLDNAVDFLAKNYKGADDTFVDVTVFKDDKLFRLKIRNSNYKNIPLFPNLKPIFDYDMRYGSKQDVHVISRGMLGDALKQILAFEYILIHVDYDEQTKFQDKQPKHPLIIRHNGKEFKVYLKVDKIRQSATVEFNKSDNGKVLKHTDTEIELTLPVIDEVRHQLNRTYIEEFCKKYPIFTTDITFRFHITDNSDYPQQHIVNGQQQKFSQELATALSSKLESPKATINLEYPALHPISSESWYKQNSVYSYTPEEFKRTIINIDPQQTQGATVYDILGRYREASNLKKKERNAISIAKLLSLPSDSKRNREIQNFYTQLRNALPPPQKLVLPYTNNKSKRKVALIERVRRLYNQDDETEALPTDTNRAAYKSIHGFHNDVRKGIAYPYFFEILAIPFAFPLRAKKRVDFIGAINYSVSTKEYGSLFEGEYVETLVYYDNPETDPIQAASDILGVLEHYGFHQYVTDSAKVPCVIVANLVTPRRDPHGQDKTRIDTTPFTQTISEAVRKLSSEIQTYRAAGHRFNKPSERRSAKYYGSGKKTITDILRDYLIREHGLPSVVQYSDSDNDYEQEMETEEKEQQEEEDATTT